MKGIPKQSALLLCLAAFSFEALHAGQAVGFSALAGGQKKSALQDKITAYQRRVSANQYYINTHQMQEILEAAFELKPPTPNGFTKKGWNAVRLQILNTVGVDINGIDGAGDIGISALPRNSRAVPNGVVGKIAGIKLAAENQHKDFLDNGLLSPVRVERVAKTLNDVNFRSEVLSAGMLEQLSDMAENNLDINSFVPAPDELVDAVEKLNRHVRAGTGGNTPTPVRLTTPATKAKAQTFLASYRDFLDAGGRSTLYTAALNQAQALGATMPPSRGGAEGGADLKDCRDQLKSAARAIRKLSSPLKQGMKAVQSELTTNVEALVDAANAVYGAAQSSRDVTEAASHSGPQVQTVFGHALDPYFEFFRDCRDALAVKRGVVSRKSPIGTVKRHVLAQLSTGGGGAAAGGGDADATQFVTDVRNALMSARTSGHRGPGDVNFCYRKIKPDATTTQMMGQLQKIIDRDCSGSGTSGASGRGGTTTHGGFTDGHDGGVSASNAALQKANEALQAQLRASKAELKTAQENLAKANEEIDKLHEANEATTKIAGQLANRLKTCKTQLKAAQNSGQTPRLGQDHGGGSSTHGGGHGDDHGGHGGGAHSGALTRAQASTFLANARRNLPPGVLVTPPGGASRVDLTKCKTLSQLAIAHPTAVSALFDLANALKMGAVGELMPAGSDSSVAGQWHVVDLPTELVSALMTGLGMPEGLTSAQRKQALAHVLDLVKAAENNPAQLAALTDTVRALALTGEVPPDDASGILAIFTGGQSSGADGGSGGALAPVTSGDLTRVGSGQVANTLSMIKTTLMAAQERDPALGIRQNSDGTVAVAVIDTSDKTPRVVQATTTQITKEEVDAIRAAQAKRKRPWLLSRWFQQAKAAWQKRKARLAKQRSAKNASNYEDPESDPLLRGYGSDSED